MKKTTLMQWPLMLCLAAAVGVSAAPPAAVTDKKLTEKREAEDRVRFVAQDKLAARARSEKAKGTYLEAIKVLNEVVDELTGVLVRVRVDVEEVVEVVVHLLPPLVDLELALAQRVRDVGDGDVQGKLAEGRALKVVPQDGGELFHRHLFLSEVKKSHVFSSLIG